MKIRNAFALALLGLAMSSAAWAASDSVSVTVSATIPPLFELSVSGPHQGNIEFGVIHKDPAQPVVAEAPEVVLTARSNLGRPYEIKQELMSPLANERNDRFGDRDLSSTAVNLRTDGAVAGSGTPVSTRPQTLFTSNAEGKSDTIKARYRLRVVPEQPSGNYRTKLVYTITTI
jgi:hypothetical protein